MKKLIDQLKYLRHSILLIVMLTIAIVIVYAPEDILFDSVNPYSYTQLQHKYERLDQEIVKTTRAEEEIHTLNYDFESYKAEASALSLNYGDIVSQINTTNWKLHHPSLLILLEQRAHADDMEISIAFNSMTDPEPLPDNPYLQTVILPITVKGSYDAITKYLTFLDKTDFIDPYEVKITSRNAEKAESEHFGEADNKCEIELQILVLGENAEMLYEGQGGKGDTI